MDAQEGLAVQRLFQLAEHRVHEMGVAVHVNAHIIAFGLQPPDVGEREAALVASDLNPEVGLRHGERAAFELGEARLEKGEPLLIIHARDTTKLEAAMEVLRHGVRVNG